MPPQPLVEEICGDGIDNDCDPETVCVQLEQNGKVIPMTPIDGQHGVVTFYGYSAPENSSSANTGYEVSDAAVLFAYRDPQDNISLVFILDKIKDGSGGKFHLQYSGAQGMEVLVYDDHLGGNDSWDVDLVAGTGDVLFKWGQCCTDGLALGYLEEDFCIEFTMSQAMGIQQVLVYEHADSSVPLDGSASFKVCSGQ